MKSIHGDKKDLRYQCEKCEFATEKKQSIEKHQKVHEKYEEKLKLRSDWFKCEKCPTLIATKQYLNEHISKVHESLLVECDLCGKTLKFIKQNLISHFRKVHKKFD